MKVKIIGQGLAGTLVGYRFERMGHTVHYQDDFAAVAASDVAAGIVNPITGRRFVKSWRFDELLPEAKAYYRELEDYLGGRYWLPQPLIRTLYNRGDLNDWQVRTAEPGYQPYMEDGPATGRLKDVTRPVFAYAGVRRAGRVAVGELVRDYRARLVAEDRISPEPYDYTATPPGDTDYDATIFCEGAAGHQNPFFPGTGQTPGNKGQVLIIQTDAPPLQLMFKHRVFLVPSGGNTYWVGATSENKWAGVAPDQTGRAYLKARLDEVITVPYRIVDHRAALRPTVRDRRMVIGRSPVRPNTYIFNGLGTKGASLGPLGSKWLYDFIVDDRALPPEVDYLRFR